MNRFFCLHLTFAACFLAPAVLFADNAVPVASGQTGDFQVTVFGHPAPLRPGPSRIEWFVEKRDGTPVDFSDWRVELHPPEAGGEAWIPPCCRMESNSSNDSSIPSGFRGFLRSSNPVLTSSGSWVFRITPPQADPLDLTLSVGKPLSPWFRFWPWFAAPIVFLFLAAWNITQSRDRSPQSHSS